MSHHLKVAFWIRRTRTTHADQVPIILRITIGNERKDKHSGHSTDLKDWDSDKGMLLPRNPTNRAVNDLLDQMRFRLISVYGRLIQDSDCVTVDDLLKAYDNKTIGTYKLMELVKLHNEDFKARLTIDRTNSTYEKYLFTEQKLSGYLWKKYKVRDMPLNKLNLSFIREFYNYLYTTDNNCHNTIAKYLKNLKRIINYGIELEWISSNPFLGYKIGYKNTEQVVLSPEELETIRVREFSMYRLQLVKDLFIFQCYTGLSYVDMKLLTKQHIRTGPDGDQWIYLQRTKTGTRAAIPLFEHAREIMNRYNPKVNTDSKERIFPAYCIHKANAYLKEIADICGIEKNLTTHVGRRTFATTVLLNNGTPIEVISKVLGHLNIKTTQVYARVSDYLVKKEMQQVSQKIGIPKPKTSSSLPGK